MIQEKQKRRQEIQIERCSRKQEQRKVVAEGEIGGIQSVRQTKHTIIDFKHEGDHRPWDVTSFHNWKLLSGQQQLRKSGSNKALKPIRTWNSISVTKQMNPDGEKNARTCREVYKRAITFISVFRDPESKTC